MGAGLRDCWRAVAGFCGLRDGGADAGVAVEGVVVEDGVNDGKADCAGGSCVDCIADDEDEDEADASTTAEVEEG